MCSQTPSNSDKFAASTLQLGRTQPTSGSSVAEAIAISARTSLGSSWRWLLNRGCVLTCATAIGCGVGTGIDALFHSAFGQARNYEPRFRIETNGFYTMFGNAVTTCSTSSSNGGRAFFLCDDAQRGDRTDAFGTNNVFFMEYVDVDSDPSTFNSSSSDLTLPVPSSDVVWAGLYWSGDTSFGQDFNGLGIPTGSNAPTPSDNDIMLLRAPGDGSYRTIQADNIDSIGTRFSAVADITSLIQSVGNGTYFGANIQAGTGPDRYGGWAIVVVYLDASQVLRNITVFDGFQQVGNNTVDATVSNFLTPPTGVFDTSIGIIANEGDVGFSGDQFLIDGGRGLGFITVGDSLNPSGNFFNSSNTILDTAITSRNPSFTNLLAVDIDIVEASFIDPSDSQQKSILANGATSASLRFTSTGDFYFPTTLVFSTQVFQPVLTADFLKTVTDDDGNDVLPGDILTYEVSFTNTGNDASTGTLFTDAIPANTSFVSNSLEVLQDDANPSNVGAKSDIGDDEAEFDSANNQIIFRLGNGASSSQGGNLNIGDAVRVRFKVRVDPGISSFPTTISNQADIDYIGLTTGQPFTGVSNDPSTSTSSDPTEIDVVAPPPLGISGRVFEDMNYGGGEGRDYATADGASTLAIDSQNATVELYEEQGGNFIKVASTTTANDGTYSFDSAVVSDSTTYRVRVVNDTVPSRRPGGNGSELAVQTFRNDPDETAGNQAITSEVGGADPTARDAGAQANGTDLSAITAQSVTEVAIGGSGISTVDFGFNFDTIVNTNDSGQGSLRQFITNANQLANADLDQDGLTAGVEHSIFMIPAAQLTSGVAVITPGSPLPAITDDSTAIDGTTQTANIGDNNSGSVGTGGTVGTGADAIEGTGDDPTLSTIAKPEVEIRGNNSIQIGLDLVGNSETVRGIALYGYGFSDGSGTGPLHGDIIVRGTSALIEGNILGSAAATVADPGAGVRTGGAHIYLDQGSETTIQNNLIAYSLRRGIFSTEEAVFTFTIANNEIRENNRENDFQGGGIEFTSFAGTFGGSSSGVINPQGTISGNLIVDNSPAGEGGKDNGIEFGGTTDANVMVRDNTIAGNSTGISAFSLKLPKPHDNDITIVNNVIRNNAGSGIDITSQRGYHITRNSIYDNIGLGIQLGAGPNDGAFDTNPGSDAFASTPGNDAIDYPVVTSATLTAGTLQVQGFVGNLEAGSTTFANTTLEFFIADNDPADQNTEVILGDGLSVAHGEGRTYLGSCAANANSLFDCSFSNAGTLGLTDPLNITATTTVTRPDGKVITSQFGAVIPPVTTNPEIKLVKRITAVNGIDISGFDGNDARTEDEDPNWPTPLSTYLRGSVSSGIVGPGDQVEFTIYFLSSGDDPLGDLTICDLIPANMSFDIDGFVGQTPLDTNSASGTYVGIALASDDASLPSAPTVYLSNTDDGDRGRFYPPDTEASASCNQADFTAPLPAADNPTGAVVVEVVSGTDTLPAPTGPGAPADTYGFIRFKSITD